MSSESGGAPASSSGSSSSSSNAPKKSLSELTQPELLSKCQTLLSIAQKSKAAKDDAVSKLGAKSKEASTLQEMVNKLQEERVSAATAAESVKRRTGQIERNFDQLETEKLGLDRQVRRLIEENEDLLGQLDTMDQKLKVESEKGEPDIAERLKISEEKRAMAETELESINSRRKAESDGVAELRGQKAKLEDELMAKSSRLAEMENAVTEANSELEVSRLKLAGGETEAASLRGQLEAAEAKFEDFEDGHLKEFEERLKAERDKVAELQESKAKTEDKLGDQSLKLMEMEKALSEATSEMSVTREKLTESEKMAESTRAQLEEAEKKCEELKNSRLVEGDLKAKSEQVAELLESKTRFESELKTLSSRNQAMEIELSEVKSELSDARGKLTESESVEDSRLDRLGEAEKKYESLCSDFDEVKEKLKAESDKVIELLESKANVESELDNLSSRSQGVETEVQEVRRELSNARQQFQESEALASSLKSQLDDASKRHEDFAEELKAKEDEISNLTAELKSAKETTAKLEVNLEKSEHANDSKEQLEMALKVTRDASEKNAAQAEKMAALEETNWNLNADNERLADQSARKTRDHEGRVAKLASSIKGLASDYRRFRAESAEVVEAEKKGLARFREEQELALAGVKQSLLRQIAEAESQNSDLIDEMNQMNMELKRRGELIESLKSDIAVKKSEENLAAQSQAEVTELRAKVEELKKELSDTKKHLEKKSMTTTTTTAVQDDAQSETMSTSTVSRVEEQSRMADIEASFEDRYGKLKLVALKLKKKTVEQEAKIKELQANTGAGTNNKQLATLTKNCASLQARCDELADQVDAKKAQLSSAKKDLEAAISEGAAFKVSAAELEEENKRLKAEKTSFLAAEKRAGSLDAELENAEKKVADLSEECGTLREKTSVLESDLARETDLRSGAEKLANEVQSSLTKESERAQDLKTRLSTTRESLSAAEASLQEARADNSVMQRKLEETTTENEKLKCEVSDLSGTAAARASAMTKRSEALQKMVHLLESDLDRKSQSLKKTEERLSDLEKEYEGYKIRAASVLRKAKDDDEVNKSDFAGNNGGNRSQEVIALERMVEALNTKIGDLSTQLSASALEQRHLQEDHDRLMTRHSALLQEMAAKETAARSKHDQLVTLAQQSEKAKQDAEATALRNTEGLKQGHRAELEQMQSKHSAEVSKLQKHIDDLDNQVIRMQMTVVKATAAGQQTSNSPQPAHHSSSAATTTGRKTSPLNVSLIEREAAEGSESSPVPVHSAVSPSTPQQHQQYQHSGADIHRQMSSTPYAAKPTTPMPLDQLLFASTGSIDLDDENPQDGICLAEDSEALQELNDLPNQVAGDWWVVKGQNCGQDGWPGGYDWYPCQGNIEYYKYMSFPHPDYVFVAWCATGPLVDHNGAFILSRGRNLAGLADLPEVEAELLATAEKLGIDYNTMCESDNTDCPV